MKQVYVAMCADIIHHGHINIIKQARKCGEVTVGLLTDDAIISYKRQPILTYEQRKLITENIKGVRRVIPQETLSWKTNLIKLRPDFAVHGDDWKTGVQKNVRAEVVAILKEWNGRVVDVPYTNDISSTEIIRECLKNRELK